MDRNKAAKLLLHTCFLAFLALGVIVGCGGGSNEQPAYLSVADTQPANTPIPVVVDGDRIIFIQNSPNHPFGQVEAVNSEKTYPAWTGQFEGDSTKFVVTSDADWMVQAWDNADDVGNFDKALVVIFQREN